MIFQQPIYIALALLLLVCFFYVKKLSFKDDWHKVIKKEVIEYLRTQSSSVGKRMVGFLAASIGALALSGPSIPATDTESYKQTQGWIVIADISRSMTLADTAPSRLSAMRDTANELAMLADTHPISLIVYAGDAFLVSPPAFDTNHYKTNVSLLDHGLLSLEGSNLARALALATSMIENNLMLNSRIIVLSDSGGISASTHTAVNRLADQGHRVDMIVFGTQGSDAGVEFDLGAAQSLANSGKGIMLNADALGYVELSKLNTSFSRLLKDSLIRSDIALLRWTNQSHWLLLLALPILLVMFARERS